MLPALGLQDLHIPRTRVDVWRINAGQTLEENSPQITTPSEPLTSVFMTRKDLTCVHEPFGDAFYYGPERLSSRFESDELARAQSGFDKSTYKTVYDRLEAEEREGKRVFIKDILHYLLPPDRKPPQIAPSLVDKKRGIGTLNGHINGAASEPGNPTVVPQALLERFHFTFLIRDPHCSVPSYFRCTRPPLVEMTGWHEFWPNEAGYDELRQFFDYMRASGQIGPKFAQGSRTIGQAACNGAHTNGVHTNGVHTNGVQTNGVHTNGEHTNDEHTNGEHTNGEHTNGEHTNGEHKGVEVCVVDADDLLDDPEGIIQLYCKSVGLDYRPDMLRWDDPDNQARAKKAFEKWKGFHEDAINSKDLKPRQHKKAAKTEEQWDAEWKELFGEQAARMIRKTVDDNMAHYLYLKQFALVSS
ncbi:hypothetical protein DV737_g4848, partial [Chaetothyriales sp. CBS 132003]